MPCHFEERDLTIPIIVLTLAILDLIIAVIDVGRIDIADHRF